LQQMRHLLHHPPEHRGIGALDHLVELTQSQTLDHQLMLHGSADGTAVQLDLDFAFHHSFSTAMPRISATAALSRSDSSATIVAFTTMCGLRRPMDLVSTL